MNMTARICSQGGFLDQMDILPWSGSMLHVSGSYSQKLKLMSKELAEYQKKFFLNQKNPGLQQGLEKICF